MAESVDKYMQGMGKQHGEEARLVVLAAASRVQARGLTSTLLLTPPATVPLEVEPRLRCVRVMCMRLDEAWLRLYSALQARDGVPDRVSRRTGGRTFTMLPLAVPWAANGLPAIRRPLGPAARSSAPPRCRGLEGIRGPSSALQLGPSSGPAPA